MVWRDLGLNPDLPDQRRTLYPLGQWADAFKRDTYIDMFAPTLISLILLKYVPTVMEELIVSHTNILCCRHWLLRGTNNNVVYRASVHLLGKTKKLKGWLSVVGWGVKQQCNSFILDLDGKVDFVIWNKGKKLGFAFWI